MSKLHDWQLLCEETFSGVNECQHEATEIISHLDKAIAEKDKEIERLRSGMTFDFTAHEFKRHQSIVLTREEIYGYMEDEIYEQLSKSICKCEPVGESNFLECNCYDYASEFELDQEANQ
jgi:hypothetical protein